MSRRLPRLGAAKANALADAALLHDVLLGQGATSAATALYARDLLRLLPQDWDDRRIRAAAEVDGRILSAPGSAGYAALLHDDAASRAYALECSFRHRSQVRHQLARAERIEQAVAPYVTATQEPLPL